MSLAASPYVSLALSRLRVGVTLCCWVVALSLLTQLMVWGTATFLDVRYETLPEQAPTQLIVSASEASRPIAGESMAKSGDAVEKTAVATANANRVPTRNDKLLRLTSSIAMTTGTLGMIILLPLLVVGVLLGAGSATPGVERVVSAFMWSVVVLLLVLPVGSKAGLPWQEGALVSYSSMTEQVDREIVAGAEGWGSATFYARYAGMPLACVIGLAVIGLRFGSGVAAGIIPREDMRLDPVLEKEAANIKATSLHAGRAAAALKAASAAMTEKKPTVGATNGTNGTPILQAAAGEVPRRLI